jgi:DNA ligase-associated metallophosphoesterase
MFELQSERLPLAADPVGQPISLCGKALLGDHTGVLYWPAQQVLLVADLNLDASADGDGGARLRHGTRETLIRLAQAIDRYQPRSVIALGHHVHAAGALPRIGGDDLERLSILQEDREWIWLSSTSDGEGEIARGLGGRVTDEIKLAGISLRQRPLAGAATPEIAGHMHPAAKLSLFGTPIRRPCFVANGRRLMLPAFGGFAGGRNVLDDAFRPYFGNGGMAVWVLGQEALYPVAARLLSAD